MGGLTLEPQPLRDSGESAGAPMTGTRYLPSGPECQSSPRASLSHADTIAGRGEGHSAQIQNDSGLPQGLADHVPGRLEDAANRLSRGSRGPVYDGGGTWGGSRMVDLRRRDFVTLLS